MADADTPEVHEAILQMDASDLKVGIFKSAEIQATRLRTGVSPLWVSGITTTPRASSQGLSAAAHSREPLPRRADFSSRIRNAACDSSRQSPIQ